MRNMLKNMLRNGMLVSFLAAASLSAQGLILPQIADGGGWYSTVVLTNTTPSPVNASLKFYRDTTLGSTEPWTTISFLNQVDPDQISIAGGSSVFLQTTGTAETLTQGWGEILATAGVEGYAIYTQTTGTVPNVRSQDATAAAVLGSPRILMPFDNTGGLTSALAIVNPNSGQVTISVNLRTSDGNVTKKTFSLPGEGQMAFVLIDQFPETTSLNGLAEFYTSTGSIAMIALRANATGAFTSAPVYPETGAAIISSRGGGTPTANSMTYPSSKMRNSAGQLR